MSRRCVRCRAPLEGGRRDRRYCDDLCRQLERDRRDPSRGRGNAGACARCGEPLADKRAGARYCSSACRVAVHRARAAH